MKILFYRTYLKKRVISDENILFSKTNDSYLIGPKINEFFDEKSFFKRLKSSSIYTRGYYKNCSKKVCKHYLDKYLSKLKNNQVIEVFKSGKIVNHSIIPVPKGVNCEK